MSKDSTSAGLNRRTVITAGAWAVPAVVLATATPAAAVGSLERGQLQFTHVAAWVEGSPNPVGIAGSTTVQLKWSATAQVVEALTVVFRVAKEGMAVAPAQIVSGAGWSVGEAEEDTTHVIYTVHWGGTLDPAQAGLTSELRTLLPGDGLTSAAFPKTATATVASTQAMGETVSGTLVNTATPENPIIFISRVPDAPP